ncbi:MAG: hypothetical protein RMI83_04165 [Desulfurococcaceae archaeon]|nr:hypothetical protein [Sulfolobales archaeon]MDW8170282.1 hypothetical protein [Desulfurococcaceae archaeon]
MSSLTKMGFSILLVGLLIMVSSLLAYFIYLAIQGFHGAIGVGGCIIVLFIPICFGLGERGDLLMTMSLILALALVAALLALFIYSRKVSYIKQL